VLSDAAIIGTAGGRAAPRRTGGGLEEGEVA
jgi:hypothetical protein